MFNVFKFFKKKEKKAEEEETKQTKTGESTAAEKKISDEELDKEIVIHVMPSSFRLAGKAATKAKKTGLLILIGGAVFFLAVLAGLYFFLFKATPAKKGGGGAVQETANKTNVQNKTKKATSTPKKEEERKATSTPALTAGDEASSTTTASTTPRGDVYSAGRDTDGEGLTDKEESLLGTDAAKADTDGDNYSDLTEIMNLYNPSVYANGRLLNNEHIKRYMNSVFGYSIFHPAAWAVDVIGENDAVMFKSPENQFVQMIVQPNPDRQTIVDWYAKQFNAEAGEEIKTISGNGWQGVKNESGLVVYLTDKRNNYIFTLAYNTGADNILDYINIFNMMVKSLSVAE